MPCDSKEIKDWHINKSTLLAFFSICIYKIALDLSYYFIISPVWSYVGFELHFNALKLVESYILLVIIFILIPKSSTKLSNILIWLLILFSYIPMLTVFAFKDEARIFMYAVTGFWILIFLLLHLPSISITPLKQSGVIRYSLFVCLALLTVVLIWRYYGLSFNINLTNVYDIRSEYIGTENSFAGYLFPGMAKIVIPIFFTLFIIKRKWLPAAIVIVLEILLFSATGNRQYLLAIPFILVLMWIMTRKNKLAYISLGISVLLFAGILSYLIIDNIWISSFFIRRSLLVPAQLTFIYYDFFSQNEPLFLSHSIFSFLYDYSYYLTPPHLIADIYFNQPQMGSNTGVVGDAYMNFGFIGFAIWGIILSAILKLIDSCSKGVDLRIGVAAIAMPAIALTNSALLTSLLTHGILLSLVFLYLLPRVSK